LPRHYIIAIEGELLKKTYLAGGFVHARPTRVMPIHKSATIAGILAVLLTAWACATPVAVTIVDANSGRPIAGATVARIQRGQTLPAAMGQTDADGRISLDCDSRARTAFIAAAPGKTPRTFGFWGSVPPTHRVALQPSGGSMSGRLEDAGGKPIAGAAVQLVFFDQFLLETLDYETENPRITFPMQVRTDADGRFTLPVAPDNYVQHILFEREGKWLDVTYAPGYWDPLLRRGDFVGRPSGLPIPQAVPVPPAPTEAPSPTLAIHLRVLDANTNQPIEHVRVTAGGSTSPDQSFRTLSHSTLDLPGDNVAWMFHDHAWAYFLRIEADGYAAAPTRIVKASEKQVDLELKLNPAKRASLAVLTADGHPAAGAKAYIATPTVSLRVPTGNATIYDPEPFAVAGADGILHFSPPDEAYRLAILHSQGSAEISLASAGDMPVSLTPWASIDLSVGPEAKPLAGVFVESQALNTVATQALNTADQRFNISWIGLLNSDDTGKAALTYCRPCDDLQISAQPPKAGGQTRDGWSFLEFDQKLTPGQHVNARVMTGKTTVRAVLVQPGGYEWSYVSLNPRGPATGLPADFNQLPQTERAAVLKAAVHQKPDPHADEITPHDIRPVLHKDGSIAITGLASGVYDLTSFAQPVPGAPDQSSTAQPVTQPGKPPRLDWLFAVPDSQPTVVELGTVAAVASQTPVLQVGQVVPDLDSTTLDGKPFHLKDLRGHWVLLDFWGTWCGFCIAEEPTLKDACEGWTTDGRLTMVSASVDDTPEQVRKHVAEKQLSWTQLVLGMRDKTQIPQTFGVDGYPTIMLISPEGKLIEIDLRGGFLRDALIRHLGPASPPRDAGPAAPGE
jgi:thiol-disulfide isomerase/thioredoxin